MNPAEQFDSSQYQQWHQFFDGIADALTQHEQVSDVLVGLTAHSASNLPIRHLDHIAQGAGLRLTWLSPDLEGRLWLRVDRNGEQKTGDHGDGLPTSALPTAGRQQ